MTLTFARRQKARCKAKLDNGEEVGLMLPPGSTLREGDYLRTADGIIVRIIAAREQVSIASSRNQLLLAKASYHLGNRHTSLQIEENCLVYLTDRVLDEMLNHLGLSITHEMRVFEPEPGAYYQPAHSH